MQQSDTFNMSELGGVTPTGSMASHLPLLFADGYPTSLEVITEKQLERFIVYMTDCSAGGEAGRGDPAVKPEWWPEGIDFAFPLAKTSQLEQKWGSAMRALVTRCYSYHDCEFMLRFSADLARIPVLLLKFVDLGDGRTALHSRESGKLLASFGNENRTYDLKAASTSKYPLPRSLASQQVIDIFPCDSSGDDDALAEMRQQEACQHGLLQEAGLPEKERFLSLLGLRRCRAVSPTPHCPRRHKLVYQGCGKHCALPFSSPLGVALQRKPHAATRGDLTRVERNCRPAKPNAPDPDSYKCMAGPNRVVRGWAHTYCYTRAQRAAQRHSIMEACGKQSSELKKCRVTLKRLTESEIARQRQKQSSELKKSVIVSLKRLTQGEIARHTLLKNPLGPDTEPARPIPLVDLTLSSDEDDSVARPPLVDLTNSVNETLLPSPGRQWRRRTCLLPETDSTSE